jgi:hypothetical protein
MGAPRIPEKISDFNSYINNSDDWLKAIFLLLVTNRERLTLTAQNGTDWSNFRVDWRDNVYPLLSNPATVNGTIRAQARTLRKNFKTFANPLLDIIAACPAAIAQDEKEFNLVLKANRDKSPTAKGKIATYPMVSIKGIGGGQMKVRVRIDEDASRASMHEKADLIELRYMVGFPDNAASSTDTPDVPTAEDAPNHVVSKKANFYIYLGVAAAGKHVLAFVRWVNTSNPENSGPWTPLIIAVIS